MANIVIKELFPSDSLTEAVEKLNFNFDQIILAGGGPPGEKGVTGSGGGQGPQGNRGNYWLYGSTYGGITSVYGGGTTITGDSFLGTAGTVYLYSTTGTTGWFDTGINLIGPTGAPGVTGGSLEVQYYLGATDIGVNSWLPATAYGATTTRSTNRDILSIISGQKNLFFLGGTSWAQQQLSDFGYYPSGSNNQEQLPTFTVIQKSIDSGTIGGIAIGGVGLTSATGGTLPTPGDLNEPVSALDFMYLGFEESTDPWNTSNIHRSVIRNPKTSMAIKVGGNGVLDKFANLSIESQFVNISDYDTNKVYITGNYSTGGTATAGFISLYSKNVGFNPLTGTGRQGILVLQGVEGSYTIGSYQHRLGTVIVGSTAGLGGNVIGGIVISRGNTGGISASNNYDSHISLHADSTANAVTKIIASTDSIGTKRTQFISQRIGLIGPSAAANNVLIDSFNAEHYTPKMPIHEIIDVANTIVISGAGSGVTNLTLPTSLQGIRVIKGTEVRESSGGGFLYGLTPEYLVQSRSLPGLTGPTTSYGYQDIIWQTYPKGATNPTPNIWLQSGATFNGSTAIGGNVIVGGVMPGGTYTGASYLGRFLTSKFAVAGAVAIGDATYYGPGVEPPSNGLRIQGDIYQGFVSGNPSGNSTYRAGISTTRAIASNGAVLSGSDTWLAGWANVMNNLGTAGYGGAGYPSWFSASFERTVIINGKKTYSGSPDYGLNLLNPSGEVASLYVNGWSLFGDTTFANSWNTLNYAPWYTGGIVATEIHIGNPQPGIGIWQEAYPTASQFSMNSTTKGFLPPRMTAAERLAISTAGATGLVVYQLAGASAFHEGLWVYQSTGWTGPLR